jgi:hypothetical protein
MDALFQHPLGPIFIILNIPKKILVKADIKQLSPKNNLRSFDENWRNTSHIHSRWVDSSPPPASFRVKWFFFHMIVYGIIFFPWILSASLWKYSSSHFILKGKIIATTIWPFKILQIKKRIDETIRGNMVDLYNP